MNKKVVYNVLVPVIDLISFILVCYFSKLILTDFNIFEFTAYTYYAIAILAAAKVAINLAAGMYKLLWMYNIRRNLTKLISIDLLIDLVILVFSLFSGIRDLLHISISISVLILVMDFVYLVVSRFAISLYLNLFYRRKAPSDSKDRTLVIGAGNAAALFLNEIAQDKCYPYRVVGLVDDSKDKLGTYINGFKVYGPIEKINELVKKLYATRIIIALPSAGMQRLKEITNQIDYKNIKVEILPDKSKILQTSLHSQIRKVEIADLLGRDMVSLDKSKLNEFITGKVILVTGGGGSIGSEICRQVLEYNPKKLVIFDIYENTTYELKTELDIKYYDKENKPDYLALIGSVRDQSRLEEVFSTYNPDIVFHAAAHKHVPLMEDSPFEAIKNNVKGTYNVAYMADKYHVQKMVLISTDKAVNPTNVMGATKRFCEMVVEAWNAKSEFTRYSMVRFGNVLGSNGSVIPLFRKQIEAGGPVTVTHEEINRFFMTIPEACGLVIQSGAYAKGGEKFILDMGKPVKIIDLARNMIKLSGLELGKDIDIEITGLRPGEKLYEELLLKTANATKTENDKIYVEYQNCPFSLEKINEIIDHLLDIGHENGKVLDYLKDLEIIKVKKEATPKKVVVAAN